MRSALAMTNVLYIPHVEAARLAAMQREQDRLGWRRQVEEFITASGSRFLLEHVTESDWDRHYAANEDAYAAVCAELEKVND